MGDLNKKISEDEFNFDPDENDEDDDDEITVQLPSPSPITSTVKNFCKKLISETTAKFSQPGNKRGSGIRFSIKDPCGKIINEALDNYQTSPQVDYLREENNHLKNNIADQIRNYLYIASYRIQFPEDLQCQKVPITELINASLQYCEELKNPKFKNYINSNTLDRLQKILLTGDWQTIEGLNQMYSIIQDFLFNFEIKNPQKGEHYHFNF